MAYKISNIKASSVCYERLIYRDILLLLICNIAIPFAIYPCCLTVSMNQTAVHSPAVSEDVEAGLGHYSLKEFSKSEENRGGGVECGHC